MKSCSECTKCCEGYLTLSEVLWEKIDGHDSCPFLNKLGVHGCSIYKHRPPMCTNYLCEWKKYDEIPEWMRPDLSKVIITKRSEYVEILVTEKIYDKDVLFFINNWKPSDGIEVKIKMMYGD